MLKPMPVSFMGDIQVAQVLTPNEQRAEIGFAPKFSIDDAIIDLKQAFYAGRYLNLNSDSYYNIKQMKSLMSQGLVK